MALNRDGRFGQSACRAALAAALLGGAALLHAAQPTGLGDLGAATPGSRAIQVLVQMQKDSVGVDSRHYQAAQRCDRAAMAEYQRQLHALAAQARSVLRNSGLETMQSIHNEQGHRIAENIAMRARDAAARQPKNCSQSTDRQPTATTGTTGTTPAPTQTPTPAPAPGPRFNSGSPLDGVRNQAWSLMEEMTDAYEQCDAGRFERALNELEQLRKNAKAAAAAATGSAEFSTVTPQEAQNLADELGRQVQQRRYVLESLKRECTKGHRPGSIGTILGPRRTPTTGTPQTAPVQPPNPQPPNCTPPPPSTQPPPESILDEIEELERWEKEQRAKQRQQQQAQSAQQGLSAGDMGRAALQQQTIDSMDAAIGELKTLVQQGRLAEADDLLDELDDWLDDLDRPSLLGPSLPREMIDGWDERIDDILDAFPKALPQIKLDISSSTILDMHNKTRARIGIAPLRWDPYLACQALSYGPTLAQHDRPVHSPRTGRETSRENLLQALPGTSPTTMMNVWIGEQRNFRPGIFPNVSSTGNWADVGHYTQMVWPKTTRVGCAIQRGIGRFDWLICRYAPPGNRDGTPLLAGNPRQPPIADNSGTAPPNSATPTGLPFDPRDIPRLPIGGGMTQLDPPPPPRPTAREEAPRGDESKHPLVAFADAADAQHAAETDCGNRAMARLELEKMRYALDELRKRLNDAREAGPFSNIKPEDIQRQIDRLEKKIDEAEQRRPRAKCAVPAPPRPPTSP